MFYDKQPFEMRENYKKMLKIIGSLSRLFSDNNAPYLPYRCHENIFCKYLEAENIARSDCSVDAKKEKIGIGLKTWVGNDDQKIAEFGKLKNTFNKLEGIELAKKISLYRNERIRITKNMNDIEFMLYHVVKRIPGEMQILEKELDYIDIENIKILKNRGNINNTYFTDGKSVYHFSTSKNTLYMIFDELELLDSFDVSIMKDPYSYLMDNDYLYNDNNKPEIKESNFDTTNSICLRLYSTKSDGTKFVPEKSGLNQWNANGRKRNPNEVYICYPALDRENTKGFFPSRDTIFNLKFPDGSVIPSKVCQQDGKSIMTNPNKELGKWLLRKVFELPENTIVTYEMLELYGIDCVIFTKLKELEYSIDFGEVGTYEDVFNCNIKE